MAILAKFNDVILTEAWDLQGVTPAKLKALNPNLKVYRLYTLNLKPTWDSDWNNPFDASKYQFPIPREKINDPNNIRGGALDLKATDDWWMRDANGSVVKESDSQWFVDIGKVGIKELYLEAVLARNSGKGFDGVVFDYWSVWMISTWLSKKGLPVPEKYDVVKDSDPTNDGDKDALWYENAWKPFITYVMNGIHAAGYQIMGNCAGEYDSGNVRLDYKRSLVDGTVYEQGSIGWPETGSNWLSGLIIEKRLNALYADPLTVMVGTYGLRSSDTAFSQKQVVDLALHYMGLPQDPTLRAKRSYHYYKDGGIFWDALWIFKIGVPSAEKVKISDKYAWSRKFTDGIVLVNYGDSNDSTEQVTFVIDKTYKDPNGNEYTRTVTLPAHTGLILKGKISD